MLKPMFAPSLMCANFLDLRQQIEILNQRADIYHVDIMDGHYVPNFSLSPAFIEQVKKIASIPIDAHLMLDNPTDFIETVAKAGADYISPHAETINQEAFRIMKKIKSFGCKAGIVLNPATSLESIKYYMDQLDKITILTVDPVLLLAVFVLALPKTFAKTCSHVLPHNGLKFGTSQDAKL